MSIPLKAVTGAVPLTMTLTLALGTGVADARPLQAEIPAGAPAGNGGATASPKQEPAAGPERSEHERPTGERQDPERTAARRDASERTATRRSVERRYVPVRSAPSADVARAKQLARPPRRASSTARVAGRSARLEQGRTLHTRLGRAELDARMRAAEREAVRRQRAQLVRRWEARAARAVRFATWQIGRPYVWGGNGRGGFDCSGLTQQAWKHAGVKLPRVAADQYQRTRPHVSVDRLKPGDLVFFHGLGHVGIYAGKGLFIHSPRTGRTVTFERLRGWYRSQYVGAARPGWVPLPELPPASPAEASTDIRSDAEPIARTVARSELRSGARNGARPGTRSGARGDVRSHARSDVRSDAHAGGQQDGQEGARTDARPDEPPAAPPGDADQG